MVIFDMDGTLADTSPGILNCVRYTQKKMGLPEISYEQMLSHVGPPMEESYGKNFGLTGERLKEAVENHKKYAIMQGYRELELYPGIRELLNALKENGIKTGIATLKAQSTVEKILIEFKLQDQFDCVIGTETEKPLTKAEMLKLCISRCRCKKEDTVLIGDSRYDEEAARTVGIDFVAVTYGFGFKTEKDVMDCKYCCDRVEGIRQYLLKEQSEDSQLKRYE